MIFVFIYLAFLISSAVVGLAVISWGLYSFMKRGTRWTGVAILGAGALGALLAFVMYSFAFLISGGSPSNLANEISLLWAAAGFAWLGAATALLIMVLRFVSGGRAKTV